MLTKGVMVRVLEIQMFDCQTGEKIYNSKSVMYLSDVLLRKDGLPCKRILSAIQSFLRGVFSGRELQINICLQNESKPVKPLNLF